MTRVGYMTLSEWSQDDGVGIPENSVRIREWLGGGSPIFVAVRDTSKITERGMDSMAADAIASTSEQRQLNLHELAGLSRRDEVLDCPLVALFPLEARECDALRSAIEGDHVESVFVLLWGDEPLVRMYLEAIEAEHVGGSDRPVLPPAAVLKAGSMIESVDYNGLAHGRGKDAVVQLVRSFAEAGYVLEAADWMRAYFAAGGSFSHAVDMHRLVREVLQGTRHRVKQAYRANIVEIIEASSS